MKLWQQLWRLVGVDLGSTRTRVWVVGEGLVLDEPSFIAVDQRNQKVIAIGQDALDLSGRVPEHIKLYQPVQQGNIEYPEVMVAYLKVLFQKVMRTSVFFRPTMMVSLPAQSDAFARQTAIDVLYQAGAREVFTIAQPLAAAIGAGVPIADTSGSFVLQMGGGLLEGGVISLGSLVASETRRQGGFQLDLWLQETVRQDLALEISLEQAKRLKHQVATLLDVPRTQLVSGQDLAQGIPREQELSSEALHPAVAQLAELSVELVKKLLEKIPPELTSDLIDKGMLLSGGLAQLQGLDQYLVQRLGVSVSVIEEPELAVIKGVGTALEHLELFKESLGYVV